MQLTTEIEKRALPGASQRRFKLPAILAAGVLFLFVLSACQVAVAEDGTVHISPESTANSGQAGANDAGAINGNTLAGLLTQAGEIDPTTVSPIEPNQVYEWNGVIRWTDLEGGHFEIARGCDNWAVIPANDEVYARLKELNGEKGTVWGTVNFDPNIFGRRAIDATSAFAPGEIRPLIALPQIPCRNVPVPGDHIAVGHGEITLHGELVWRGGRLWLVTPRGNVQLMLPQLAADMFPGLSLPETDDNSALSISLGDYGVVGSWDLTNTGLAVKVRDVQEWPHRTFVRNHCGGGFSHFAVSDEQLAAHGTLVITDGQWLLRTKSGVVYIHRNNAAGDSTVLIDPETGDATTVAPELLRTHDVVVIGEWKTDGNELHMAADKFVRVKTVCEPPQPPRQPILPGEIAALGTLVFDNGRPFLNTPQGRIVLLTQKDTASGETQPAAPSLFSEIAPELDGANGETRPDIVRPVRYILVVGKWQLLRDHLAIVVRYARPWPYPHTQSVDPVPAPEPVPPIFELPLPVPPVSTAPVDPDRPDDRDVKPEPTVRTGDVIIGPDGEVIFIDPDKKTRPSSTNTPASSFTAVSAVK